MSCKSCRFGSPNLNIIPGYNEAVAESSKDRILAQVKASINELKDVLATSIYEAALNIALNLAIVMILIFIIILIILIHVGVISLYKAIFAFILWLIFVSILAIIYVKYVTIYSIKRLKATGDVFNNFIASEDVLRIINNSAAVYLGRPVQA